MSRSNLLSFFDQAIVFAFLGLIFFVPIVFTGENFELFEFPKMLLVYFFAGLIFLFWTLKSALAKKITLAQTPLDLPILLFLVSQVASTIFSIDKHTSIFGYYSRFHGGLASTFAYIFLFYAFVSNIKLQDATKALFVGFFSSLFVALWGIPSHYDRDPNCLLLTGKLTSTCWAKDFQPTLRIFSTLGQPNWLGAFLAMFTPIGLALMFFTQKLRSKLFFLLSTSIIFLAFIFTNSRAAALGLLGGIIIFTFLALLGNFKFPKEKILSKINFSFALVSFVTFVALISIFGQTLLGRVQEAREAPQVSPGETQAAQIGGTESGQIRLIVWQGAIDIFRNYPLFGSGVETFGYSYYNFRPANHNLTTEWNFLYNKAHNEYLNYLATTGFLGFASYLALLIIFLFISLKIILDTKNILIIGITSGLISYLVQNFFGFSVVPIALSFWLFLTLVLTLAEKRSLHSVQIRTFNLPIRIFPPVLFLILVFLLARTWQGDLNYAQGLSAFQANQSRSAEYYLAKALSHTPWPPAIFYSYRGYNAGFIAQEESSQEFVNLALSNTKKAIQTSPVNLAIWRNATNTYLTLAQIDESFLKEAQIAAETAQELAPTDAETNYQLTQVFEQQGEKERAIKNLEKVLQLKPDYQEAKDKLFKLQSAQ